VKSNSALLRQKIGLLRPALEHAAAEVWADERLVQLYPELLILLHTIIRASVPLMETAATEARIRAGTHRSYLLLAEYLEKHIPEEGNHDEWLIEDLRHIGVSREQVLASIPSPHVASLVGAQYYWARHHDPICIMGYLGVLEGRPASTEFLESIQRRTGFPKEAFRTYWMHAVLDPYHRDDLDGVLDSMEFNDAQHSMLGVSLFHSITCVTLAFRELKSSSGGGIWSS